MSVSTDGTTTPNRSPIVVRAAVWRSAVGTVEPSGPDNGRVAVGTTPSAYRGTFRGPEPRSART